MFDLQPFIDGAIEKKINMDAVMVIQDDVILGLHRFTDDIYHNVYSISKSFTGTAIAMAIEDGKMALTDRPYDYFRDLFDGSEDPRWQDVTLEHLITMTSGHGAAYMMAADRQKLRGEVEDSYPIAYQKEWLLYAFSCPMTYDPGTHFYYGNLAPYVAGRMLEQAVGMTTLDYLYERLWKPLGVKKPRWDADPSGHTFPASYLFMDIVDMAQIGQIYLNKGSYRGIRFVSEDWVEAATTSHIASSVINPAGYADDEKEGYGYYFWKNHGGSGYRAYGREGQFVIVLPKKHAIIATQAMHHDVQAVLDLVWEHILPQIK